MEVCVATNIVIKMNNLCSKFACIASEHGKLLHFEMLDIVKLISLLSLHLL